MLKVRKVALWGGGFSIQVKKWYGWRYIKPYCYAAYPHYIDHMLDNMLPNGSIRKEYPSIKSSKRMAIKINPNLRTKHHGISTRPRLRMPD